MKTFLIVNMVIALMLIGGLLGWALVKAGDDRDEED